MEIFYWCRSAGTGSRFVQCRAPRMCRPPVVAVNAGYSSTGIRRAVSGSPRHRSRQRGSSRSSDPPSARRLPRPRPRRRTTPPSTLSWFSAAAWRSRRGSSPAASSASRRRCRRPRRPRQPASWSRPENSEKDMADPFLNGCRLPGLVSGAADGARSSVVRGSGRWIAASGARRQI